MFGFAGFGFLVAASLFLIFPIAIVIHLRNEKKRKEAMQILAQELAFEFPPDFGYEQLGPFTTFDLLSQGRSRKVANCMRGRARDVEVSIFDFRYVTGSGKNSTTHVRTCITFESENLALPRFCLQPEHFFHKFLTVFGYQDIDFPECPQFSNEFLLRGENEASIREFFTADLIELLDQYRGISIEAAGRRVVMLRGRKRAKIEDIRPLMEDAFRIYGELKLSCESSERSEYEVVNRKYNESGIGREAAEQ